MRVLITAATTPLCAATIQHLLDEPAVEHVLAIGRERDVPVSSRRVTYHACDLTHTRAVHDLVHGPARALGIDTVVHGALHRSVYDRGRRVHALNVETTRTLLAECERQPAIRRFVFRSDAAVYAIRATEPNLLDETAPFELAPGTPQWVRDRVESDLATCARIGTSRLSIAVLRCAEVYAPGGQLWDYLQTRVCLRPMGFDPMINLLSVEDLARAIGLAARSDAVGAFNIPGADTLPLSQIIARAGRVGIPVPGPLLAPLYHLRTWTVGLEFRYDLNLRRFHFGGILDGARAREVLGYVPSVSVWRPAWTPAVRAAQPPAQALRGSARSDGYPAGTPAAETSEQEVKP